MPKKVLIIDDDARNIFALVAILRSRKYECLTANSALQGMEILNNTNDIGIVLMDMMMPEMDGYEAIPLIKKEHNVPVVAVTAQAMMGDKEKCIEAGADDYIAKPINLDNLILLLDQYLN